MVLLPLREDSYLNYLAELSHEDLDEDYHYLAVHDHKLPEVGLRLSVAVIEKAVLPLD